MPSFVFFLDLTVFQEDDDDLVVASATAHPYTSIHAASVVQNPYDTMFGGTTPPSHRQTPPTQSQYSQAGVYSEPRDVTGIIRDSESTTI